MIYRGSTSMMPFQGPQPVLALYRGGLQVYPKGSVYQTWGSATWTTGRSVANANYNSNYVVTTTSGQRLVPQSYWPIYNQSGNNPAWGWLTLRQNNPSNFTNGRYFTSIINTADSTCEVRLAVALFLSRGAGGVAANMPVSVAMRYNATPSWHNASVNSEFDIGQISTAPNTSTPWYTRHTIHIPPNGELVPMWDKTGSIGGGFGISVTRFIWTVESITKF